MRQFEVLTNETTYDIVCLIVAGKNIVYDKFLQKKGGEWQEEL